MWTVTRLDISLFPECPGCLIASEEGDSKMSENWHPGPWMVPHSLKGACRHGHLPISSDASQEPYTVTVMRMPSKKGLGAWTP